MRKGISIHVQQNCSQRYEESFTFGKVTDERSEVVSLLLSGLADLHYIPQVVPHVPQQAGTSVHLR